MKPRVSEANALAGQLKSHDNVLAGLEKQESQVDQTSENFDRAAFKKM